MSNDNDNGTPVRTKSQEELKEMFSSLPETRLTDAQMAELQKLPPGEIKVLQPRSVETAVKVSAPVEILPSNGHGGGIGARARLHQRVAALEAELVRCGDANQKAVQEIVKLGTEIVQLQAQVRERDVNNRTLRTEVARVDLALETIAARPLLERIRRVFIGG